MGQVRLILGKSEAASMTSGKAASEYRIEGESVVWFTKDDDKPLLAIPTAMIPDLSALVYTLHNHAGVSVTHSLILYLLR